jgi:hypothetical protein
MALVTASARNYREMFALIAKCEGMKMKKGVVVGLFLVVVAALSSACSSSDDDNKLLKWQCECNHDVCAATEEAAEDDAGSCASSNFYQSCVPTGDTCVCPGGASVCKILID